MRTIEPSTISKHVKNLCIEANHKVDSKALERLKQAIKNELSPVGKDVLGQMVDNHELAARETIPLCQDTGIVVVLVEVGNELMINGDIYEAINQGVREAYEEGYLRKSVVDHPFTRTNTGDNTPAIIHIKHVIGNQLTIHVAPKGAGSENMSLVKMLTPADGYEGVKKLVIDTIFNAKGKPCPPIIVGLGVGGNLEKSAILAKEAIFRDLDDESEDPVAKQLEKELLEEINKLGIGPMGLGGTQTALAVKVNLYPCHIASLPVAINIQCHASRHKSITI